MTLTLVDFPELLLEEQTVWRVKILTVGNRDLVTEPLLRWKREAPDDFKKIMKVVRFIGQIQRVRDPQKVKPSTNPLHKGVFEMRADKGHARLFFFYDTEEKTAVAICTTTYWKGKGEQDSAFEQCARLKKHWENRHEKNSSTKRN